MGKLSKCNGWKMKGNYIKINEFCIAVNGNEENNKKTVMDDIFMRSFVEQFCNGFCF
jgi:hypothetical protein